MRFLLGWALKISCAGLIYFGVTGGFGDIKVPDTVMGYKVPDSVKRQLESANKIKELGADTTSGFKKIADSFGR
jgi:hypothetical protein